MYNNSFQFNFFSINLDVAYHQYNTHIYLYISIYTDIYTYMRTGYKFIFIYRYIHVSMIPGTHSPESHLRRML